jgi:hypothetical protein
MRDTTSQMNLRLNVGDRDRAGVGSRAHRDRHVGLCLLAEIHRPDPRLAALCELERGLGRAVAVRAHHVHAQPRDEHLLAPFAVELRDVRHFRHLSQELQEFNPAELDVARVELRQRRVGKLLLDLPDVLLDARCGGDCFLVLQVAERRLLLLIREIQADASRHQERAAHERQDEKQVFAEQPTLAQPGRRPSALTGRDLDGGTRGIGAVAHHWQASVCTRRAVMATDIPCDVTGA